MDANALEALGDDLGLVEERVVGWAAGRVRARRPASPSSSAKST